MKHSYNKQSITAELAQCMVGAAAEKANSIGKSMVIAILDESGHLKTFLRMDGAALISIEVATNKAYTALANAWGHATHEIYNYIKDDPAKLIGIPQIPRYTLLGGGFPIQIDDVTVGAIGVSGGSAEQDISVAQAALDLLKN